MSRGKRYGRQPGSDQVQQWADAVAKYKREQRQRRGKRRQGPLPNRAGMLRLPAKPKEQP